MVKLKAFSTMLTEDEIRQILGESYSDMSNEVDFETFLRVSHIYTSLCMLSVVFDFHTHMENKESLLQLNLYGSLHSIRLRTSGNYRLTLVDIGIS